MDTSQVDAVENEPLVIAATAVASGRFDLELSHCLLDRLLLIGGLDGPEIGSTEQRGISHRGGGIASNFGIEVISLTQANCERPYN